MKYSFKIKGFSLVEALLFFIVTSVILVITIPVITSQKAQQRCVPGGRVVFDGSRVITGDTSGVVRTVCGTEQITGREICKYLWKAPVKSIYVTMTGGGGGGSGAFLLGQNFITKQACEGFEVDEEGKCLVEDYGTEIDKNTHGICRSATGSQCSRHVCADRVYAANVPVAAECCQKLIAEMLGRPATGADNVTANADVCTYGAGLGVLGGVMSVDPVRFQACKTEKYKANIDNPDINDCLAQIKDKMGSNDAEYYKMMDTSNSLNYGTCVCSKRRYGHKSEPCATSSGNTMGAEIHPDKKVDADCLKLVENYEPARGISNFSIGGAGGMGGHYLFGASFSPPQGENKGAHATYDVYKRNLASPIYLTAGKTYTIIVGAGGKGGKGVGINDVNLGSSMYETHAHPEYNTSGGKGSASCLISADPNAGCTSCDTTCSRNNMFAKAEGGYGAWGKMSHKVFGENSVQVGYQLSIIDYDANKKIYYTHPFDEEIDTLVKLAGLGIPSHPDAHMVRNSDNILGNETKYKEAAVNVDALGDTPAGRAMLALGRLTALGFVPQKLGEPGTLTLGGKGGGSLFGSDRAGAGGDGGYGYPGVASIFNGQSGHNGIVELRWFSQCE